MHPSYYPDVTVFVSYAGGFRATVHFHPDKKIKQFQVLPPDDGEEPLGVFLDKLVGSLKLACSMVDLLPVDMIVRRSDMTPIGIGEWKRIEIALRHLENEWDKALPEPIFTE